MNVDMEVQVQADRDSEPAQKRSLIESEEEWEFVLEETEQDSLYLKYELKEHYSAWWKLINSAHLKKDECNVVDFCVKRMLESMPVGTLCEDQEWTCYLKGIYFLLRNKKLTPEAAERLLGLAQHKLAITYNKVTTFWNTVRNLEKKRNLPEDVYKKKCLDTYKKQFSLPYINMKRDYVEFLNFIAENSIDESEITEISTLYSENEAESVRISRTFWGCFSEQFHHVKFDQWINGIMKKGPQFMNTAIALCEEAVMDEKESVCYHLLLAKVLVKNGLSEHHRKEKLFRVLKRAISVAREECENVFYHFFDYALQAACLHLNDNECHDILNAMIDQFEIDESVSRYLSSRKAMVYGLKALVVKGKFPKHELKMKLVEVLEPVVLTELDESILKLGEESVQDFEVKRAELIKLSLMVQKEILNISWKDVMEKWEDVCLSTENPEVILEYTTFIRQYGSPEEAEDAYLKAIRKLSFIDEAHYVNYRLRRCKLLLINNLRDLLGMHGGQTDVLQLLDDLSNRHSFYSFHNKEKFFINDYPQITEPNVARLVFDYSATKDAGNISSRHVSSNHNDSAKNVSPVISDMKDLSVDHVTGSNDGFPVFISNLQYKASKQNIREAFTEKGLNVIDIRMKMTPNRANNYGFAVVVLGTKEEAEKAVSNLDHIEILGRKTFVSEYKEKGSHSSLPAQQKPTVLLISELPEEWRDPTKIEHELSKCGSVKSVEVNNEPGTAKIEYYSPVDVEEGRLMLEGVMEGTGVVIRKGFPRQKFSENKDRIKRKKPKVIVVSHDNAPPTAHSEAEGAKKDFKPKITGSFVPRQLRQQMKQKLDVPLSTDSEVDSSETNITHSSSSTDTGPSKEKRMKMASEDQKMSNNDFRAMLKK